MQAVPQVSTGSPALRFLATIMRPVVRLCMRLGVSANQANDLMRWLFVDEFYATRDLWHRKQPFASRAALLSGLSRKEVARLREMDSPEEVVVTERRNRAARVLAGWRNDKRFQDENGVPRPLPLKSQDSMCSFHALVAAYSGDVPPRTVLDELQRANCVRIEDDQVILQEAYGLHVPIQDYLSAVGFIAGALGSTTDFNVANAENKENRRPMRAWYQNNIPVERLAEAQAIVQAAAIQLGRQVDGELAHLAHRERLAGKQYAKAGMGIFYFQD